MAFHIMQLKSMGPMHRYYGRMLDKVGFMLNRGKWIWHSRYNTPRVKTFCKKDKVHRVAAHTGTTKSPYRVRWAQKPSEGGNRLFALLLWFSSLRLLRTTELRIMMNVRMCSQYLHYVIYLLCAVLTLLAQLARGLINLSLHSRLL